jgi:signal transduction histidine kinase
MGAAVAVAEGPSEAPGRRRITLLFAAVLASISAVAISVGVALAGADAQPGLVALARALIVGVPLAVGLHTWYRRPAERVGLVLIVAGAAGFVSTLAESRDELLYSLGRLAGWLIPPLLVYLFLSFPAGRLSDRRDRLAVLAMAAVVVVMYLPRLFLSESFELPSPYTSCVHDCPANAFVALDAEPAFVAAFLRPAGVVLAFLVMAAVVLRLRGRLRDATPLTRRMLTPVLAVAMLYAGLFGVAIVARQIDPTAWPLELAAWLLALAVPAVALAFFLGLLQWRLYAEGALQSLAACLRDLPDPAMLQRAFADAFRDPSIEIVFPAANGAEGWLDARAQPVTLPQPGTGRRVTDVRNHGVLVAALVHDEGLLRRPELLEAGASMAAVVLDNQRLAAQAEASIRELLRSRARIASSAESERRRIERDLHDGAQQRLVALRIELELAEDVVRQDPERGVARLRELERVLDEALEDLRSLAHGVYPPLLADRGLSDALRAVAMGSSIHVDLDADALGRYAPEVESAVYFCVLEALQNVLKHATGARRVRVRVAAGPLGELHFSVRDDGAGTDGLRPGAGITNMQDRLAASGGEVTITSTSGVGTHVRGRVPASPLSVP